MAIRNAWGYVRKTVEIVDWDMLNTSGTNVLHGLSATEWKTIRSLECIIRDDTDTFYWTLGNGYMGAGSGLSSASIDRIDSTVVKLGRLSSGEFDNTGYDSLGGYVRGWLNFEYLPD